MRAGRAVAALQLVACLPGAAGGLLESLGLWIRPRSAKQVEAGEGASLIVTQSGRVFACGDNSFSLLGVSQKLGDAFYEQAHVPVSAVKQVSLASSQSLFLMDSPGGEVSRAGYQICGDPNATHCRPTSLGGGKTVYLRGGCDNYQGPPGYCRPDVVHELGVVKQVAASRWASYFLMEGGSLYVMGFNQYGQLGTGDKLARDQPVQVSGLGAVKQVAASDWHALFLMEGGEVFAVGDNTWGQLATGDKAEALSPVQVRGLGYVVQVAAGRGGGEAHSLFLLANGTVLAAGHGGSGALGLGVDGATLRSAGKADYPEPVRVPVQDVKQVAAGCSSSLFLTTDGDVYAAGDNSDGQLGPDDFAGQIEAPMRVEGFPGAVAQISAGCAHSLFLMEGGHVMALGRREGGELCGGQGDSQSATGPVTVEGFSPGWTVKGLALISMSVCASIAGALAVCGICRGDGEKRSPALVERKESEDGEESE